MLKLLPNAAGKRRTFVTIQVGTNAARDTSMSINPEFLTEYTRWAEEMMTSGREFQQAMQTVAALIGIIKLPYDAKTAAISARDRIVIGSRVLNIVAQAINEGGRNETIVLWLTEPEQP